MKFEHVVAVVGYQTEGSLCSWFDKSLRCTHMGSTLHLRKTVDDAATSRVRTCLGLEERWKCRGLLRVTLAWNGFHCLASFFCPLYPSFLFSFPLPPFPSPSFPY